MESSIKRAWLHNFRSSETFVILVVSIAIFTDVFIYGIIVPIIPIALVERAGAREEDAQYWVSILLAVYGGTLLLGSPLFGYFADRCRLRQLPFVMGLLALGGSTGLFILVRSLPGLIIARALQGLSAAAVWVVGLAILADNVPPERVSEAMGHTTIALTWGFLLGPTAGGVMYEKLGFYGTFAVPVGLIVVDVVLRFAMVEKPAMSGSIKPSLLSQDSNGRVASYNTFNSREDSNPRLSSEYGDTTDEGASLVAASDPYVEDWAASTQQKATVLDLLRFPRLPLALGATVTMAVTVTALETTLPLYVIKTFHWSTSGAGLIFIAASVPSFAGVYIGKIVSRFGAHIPEAIAFSIASGAWILMCLINHDTTGEIVSLVSLILLLGLAICVIEVAVMTEVFEVIEDYEAEFPGAFGEKSPVAQAYALFNMAFASGQLLGPILAGGIRVRAGWGLMTLVLGFICGVTAVLIAMFGVRKKRVQDEIEECEE